MGKQLASKRIGELVTALGLPTPPAAGSIKNQLMAILPEVEALEAKLGLPELVAQYDALKAQNNDTRSQLEETKKECDRLQQEQAKRDYDEKTDLPEIQFRILECLNVAGGGNSVNADDIRTKIYSDSEEVLDRNKIIYHLTRMQELDLVSHWISGGVQLWNRTHKGNGFAVARKLTEESSQPTGNGSVRRSAIEEKILLFLKPENLYGFGEDFTQPSTHVRMMSNHVKAGVKLVKECLETLKGDGLVILMDKRHWNHCGKDEDGSDGWGWARTDKADEYLSKHELL